MGDFSPLHCGLPKGVNLFGNRDYKSGLKRNEFRAPIHNANCSLTVAGFLARVVEQNSREVGSLKLIRRWVLQPFSMQA